MAIIAVLFGGLLGFVSFLTAIFAFDANFLTAGAIYMSVGLVTATFMITLGMIQTPAQDTPSPHAVSA